MPSMEPQSCQADIGGLVLHGVAHQSSLAMREHRVQAPKAEAATILQRRFPVPRLVDCDQNGFPGVQPPAACSYIAESVCMDDEVTECSSYTANVVA